MLFTRGKQFIATEVRKLLKKGLIGPSVSPWKAQALIIATKNHKKRMVIDYSQTINRYTLLDVHPLPHIDKIISNIGEYHIFITLDLRSAYHQVLIKPEDKPYMAFKA